MKKSVLSRKAQEIHAEHLLKLSTRLMTAFFVVILIVPIISVIAASFNHLSTISSIDFFLESFGSWYFLVFMLIELGLYHIVVKTRGRALSIYTELYPDADHST